MIRKSKETFFLGITGGVACGKTFAYDCFLDLGACGISTDQISRDLTRHGQHALREIEEAFGKEVIGRDGELDRKRLGKIVFSNREKREVLNRLLHPRVEKVVLRWAEKVRKAAPAKKLAVIEIPLLFETGNYYWVDGILVVSAQKETSLRRMQLRDGIQPEDCLSRYESQIPLDEKKNRLDG